MSETEPVQKQITLTNYNVVWAECLRIALIAVASLVFPLWVWNFEVYWLTLPFLLIALFMGRKLPKLVTSIALSDDVLIHHLKMEPTRYELDTIRHIHLRSVATRVNGLVKVDNNTFADIEFRDRQLFTVRLSGNELKALKLYIADLGFTSRMDATDAKQGNIIIFSPLSLLDD